MHPRLRQIFALAALMFCAISARAQIVFTFTGTADGNCLMLGYTTPGAAVTFTVVANSIGSNGDSIFGQGGDLAGVNYWGQFDAGEGRLFTSLTGTGLTNNLSVLTLTDPASNLKTSSNNRLDLNITTNNANHDLGPTINSGTQLYIFNATATFGVSETRSFPTLLSYTDPVAYFTNPTNNLLGTYTDFNFIDVTLTDAGGAMVEFNITSLTISAIPEPATCSAIAGLIALGAMGVREMKRRKLA